MHTCLPIESKRLLIRQFRAGDAADFHSWRDNADVARYMLWDYPYPHEEAEKFCKQQAALESLPIGQWCQLMIELREGGKPIGDIGLGLDVDGDGAIELGYSLLPEYWGKGLMPEAIQAVLPAVAAATGLATVKATVDARNPASDAVLRRLGFECGPLMKRAAFVKGEWCDEYHYVKHLRCDKK